MHGVDPCERVRLGRRQFAERQAGGIVGQAAIDGSNHLAFRLESPQGPQGYDQRDLDESTAEHEEPARCGVSEIGGICGEHDHGHRRLQRDKGGRRSQRHEETGSKPPDGGDRGRGDGRVAGQRSDEQRECHPGGAEQHRCGATPVRTLKGSKAGRNRADGEEHSGCRLLQQQCDHQRNADTERAPERRQRLDVCPFDAQGGRECLFPDVGPGREVCGGRRRRSHESDADADRTI